MNLTTIKQMRQAAQSANELASKATELDGISNEEMEEVLDDHGYFSCSENNKECAVFIISAKTTVPKLADTVTQLCDEVERLREALEYITVYDSGKEGVPALDTFSANPLTIGFLKRDLKIIRTALKESNERLGE